MKRRDALLLFALGALPCALSLPASASDSVLRYRLETRFEQIGQAGQVDGVMTLTVYPSGIVKGGYHSIDSSGEHEVNGGLKDGRIWLDILGRADDRPLHLTGTFKDGVLQTTASLRIAGGPQSARGQTRTFVSVKSTLIDS
jgi:hypothetical protein